MIHKLMGATLALTLAATPVLAAELEPAVVFDMGGKFDKSFNEGVYNGVEKFKKETGIAYREFEVTNETQREQALTRMARRGRIRFSVSVSPKPRRLRKLPRSIRKPVLPLLIPWSICRTSAPLCSRNKKARSWSACWPRWRRRLVRSVSSAAWTFR